MTTPQAQPFRPRKILARLLRAFGTQRWWPARTPFEVCVGAVLTQNTAWKNVERAIAALREARALTPHGLRALSRSALARRLRPAGYFNVKERRLRAFVAFLTDEFGGAVARMRQIETHALRRRLLEVHGIGRETADSILGYAVGKPIFVVDAYTRRIFSRHGWIRDDEDYDTLRARVERAWAGLSAQRRVRDFNELHALLVAVGKDYCRPRAPRCAVCPLRAMLPSSGILAPTAARHERKAGVGRPQERTPSHSRSGRRLEGFLRHSERSL
ncbi:MAG: hypothetical protein IT578_11630 [Verrucomicrobiae bacterium]|nr:hypothetical protein [Verrucomicrobiae bacterium]